MKSQERHHLKTNEFAVQTARVAETLQSNRDRLLMIVGGIAVIATIIGVYLFMQRRTDERASALLGEGLTIQQAQIAPAPTIPGAKQQAGTYPTEQARAEAALTAFQKAIDEYPSHDAGIAARYHRAGVLLSLGRAQEAETAFAEAASAAGSSITGAMARLGQAQAQAAQKKYDEAIKLLTDLSGQRDSELPIDGVLIELARVYQRAGRSQDARATFKRVVDEFPMSPYAGEARQQMATIG